MFTDPVGNRLLIGIIGLTIISLACAWKLLNSDEEAEKLLGTRKWWGLEIKSELLELRKIKKRLVIGYWCFLIISIAGALYGTFKLVKRLYF